MEVKVEPCSDFGLLNSIVRDPAVFDGCSDDHSTAADDLSHSNMLFLLVTVDGQPGGFYALDFHTRVMAEIHTCLLSCCRGAAAQKAARAVLEWTFTNTTCMKLITLVPAFNRPALFYALRAGLRKEGVITKSFLKNGVLHDQTLLGMSRESYQCQSFQQF